MSNIVSSSVAAGEAQQIFSEQEAYKFLKVEEYFSRYKEWETLTTVDSYTYDKKLKALTLKFKRGDGQACSMRIYCLHQDIFRIRFNPGGAFEENDKNSNSRSIICDTVSDLQKVLQARKGEFQLALSEGTVTEGKYEGCKKLDLTTKDKDKQPVQQMTIILNPFVIQVSSFSAGTPFPVWETAETPIYYTPNGEEDYAIIQAVNKPASAKYIGFGEQGGQSLSKNTAQMNYFNFDNMRYRQVYNQGPLDVREPLYHSDPFFMEFNGVPTQQSVCGTFVGNAGQMFMDIGYMNSKRYMFGTRFGELNYYLFFGQKPADVVSSFTSIVGRSYLKPRYCLGYHQGCYGYERREILEWAVSKYREYQIPLDGLHVDVDVQNNYKTFTIDEGKFPNPHEMFHKLKAQGIKCSTNITPVISCRDTAKYATYNEASASDYFVRDHRHDPDNPAGKKYQLYGGGNEYCSNEWIEDENSPGKWDHYPDGWVQGFNSGEPYIGEVYYGKDGAGHQLGTPGHYADLGRFEVRKWWGTQYQYLFDMGLEMVWQDMTTPAIRESRGDMKGFPFRLLISDDFYGKPDKKTPAIKIWNLYSYNLHKATYHGLAFLKGRENKRNFIIGRGSFTGSHRFAGLWTGDNSSDWDFLKMNVSQALSLGMCGVVINGQDIGGFEASINDGGRWASPELLMRWTAAGAFLPWFRNHYVRKGRKEFQEPFMYEEWFQQYRGGHLPAPQDLYRMVLPVCKHYIELRYRLLQLFYDAMFENTLDGQPICRPLFLNDSQDESLYNDKKDFLDNEFFVGKDLLVAPVLDPQELNNNQGKRDVYLPSGSDWYCFMDNSMPLGPATEGGTTIREFDANLNTEGSHIHFIVPVYVRAGAIIPTIELEQYVGQRNKEQQINPITLNIYPGDEGEYTMYLDDGESLSSTDTVMAHPHLEEAYPERDWNTYRATKISHIRDEGSKERKITVKRIHDGYTPEFEKYFFVAILHDPAEKKEDSGCLKKIRIDEQQIELISGGTAEQRSGSLWASPVNAWYYNENINISFVKVFDNSSEISINAEYV
ncbi:MAG: glycoside hydrolase family 31 protein [Candidatus Electrothrix scaldis]|nr:MAG: glycoside hydrolase family 31 protein [Candidatus Electrothrix sp. GW3-3]